MTSVWDFFKNYFKEVEDSSASNPLVHEPIERTEKEVLALNEWRGSPECREIMAWLNDQYALWEVLPTDIDEGVDFLDTPSSKGFAVHFHKMEKGRQNAAHLLDYLKEKMLGLNYKAQMSDSRTWAEKEAVVTVERHYLKPRTSLTANAKINQQFGNVTIELLARDNIPHDLKFRATGYHDRLYEKASDFKDLMQLVLQ